MPATEQLLGGLVVDSEGSCIGVNGSALLHTTISVMGGVAVGVGVGSHVTPEWMIWE